MNTIRAVLDSGWTVAGGTLGWLLLVFGLFVWVQMRSPGSGRGHARLWDVRDGREGADG